MEVGLQPVAPPVTLRSAVVKFVTGASKYRVNSGVRSDTADAVTAHSPAGMLASRVTVEAVTVVPGPTLPAPSWTEPDVSPTMTVPATEQLTVIVTETPEVDDGANEHPDAVPVLVKSAPSRSRIVSLKVAVTLNGAKPIVPTDVARIAPGATVSNST